MRRGIVTSLLLSSALALVAAPAVRAADSAPQPAQADQPAAAQAPAAGQSQAPAAGQSQPPAAQGDTAAAPAADGDAQTDQPAAADDSDKADKSDDASSDQQTDQDAAPAAADGSPAPAAAAKSDEVAFSETQTVSTGMSASACLSFNQRLDQNAADRYAHFVTISPAAKPAFRVSENQLCLDGLSYGVSYNILVHAGLKDGRGRELAQDVSTTAAFGDQAPMVAFGGGGFVMPRQNSTGVPITSVNANSLTMHVIRISDKLLPRLMGAAGDSTSLSVDATSMDRSTLAELLSHSGAVSWSGSMTVAPRKNQSVDTAFPLQTIIPRGRDGLYLVVAETPDQALPKKFWTGGNDSITDSDNAPDSVSVRWAIATDIAITSFQGADGMHILLRSLDSGKPMPAVTVSLIANGLDTLSREKTGADGMVVVPQRLLRGQNANAPSSIVAYAPNGDFAFQNLGRPAFDLSDRGVSGRPAPAAFQAFLFADRGIYRPGETIHAQTLLRDRAGIGVTNQKITLVLRRPDGVEAGRFTSATDAAGGFAQALTLSSTAALGMWSIEAFLDPAAPAIGQMQADVEDFVPQQLNVTLSSDAKFLDPDATTDVAINGRFLYGAPAAGLHSGGDLRITTNASPVPNAKDYRFGLVTDSWTDQDADAKDLDDADDQGKASFAKKLPALSPTSLPLKAVITAGLFEPSGRFVSDSLSLPIHNQKLLVGLKELFQGGALSADAAARYAIRTFDADGNPTAVENLSWRLVREDPTFDWYRPSGGRGWTWRYHTVDSEVATGSISVSASEPATLVAPVRATQSWGSYRLIVSDGSTGAATSDRFDIGYGGTVSSADTPDRMKVSLDKPLLAAGQNATVHLEGPFEGDATILIASDRVFSQQTVHVPKEGATIHVAADPKWGAGAYVLVSMVRPLGPNTTNAAHAHDPVRAIGTAWIGIDPASHKIGVSFDAPAQMLPRQKLSVTLKLAGVPAGDHAFVSLAGVDEGILQLTRYATPDPLNFLYGKQALGLNIRDDYGRLLIDQSAAGQVREGGDAGLSSPGLPVTSTKIVSLYAGPVEVGADGTATILLDVPDFEGQLRLTAVAWSKNAVGAGSQSVIVRDPVFADVSLPRFLAPGDSATFALSVADTDGEAGVYHLALSASGPVNVTMGDAQDFTLAKGGRKQGAAQAKATGLGIATISADLSGPNNYKLHRDWQIAIRSAHPPITTQTIAQLKSGGTLLVDQSQLKDFTPGSATMAVGLTNTPGIGVPALLGSLWTYPFGCTEQLSSTAFPLLYYNASSGALPKNSDNPAAVHARVQTAIDSILDRQGADGTIGLWRIRDGESPPWLEVYALDFLAHAKASGFDVPDDALARGYARVRRIASQFDQARGAQLFGQLYASSANETIAYAEFVLAKAGRADADILQRLYAHIVSPSQGAASASTSQGAASASSGSGDAQAQFISWNPADDKGNVEPANPMALGQLAGAFSLMGQTKLAHSVMADAVSNMGVKVFPGWWFDDLYFTRDRDVAGLVDIAAETRDTKTVTGLLPEVSRFNIDPNLLTTQEKSWLLQAAYSLNTGSKASVTVNGRAMNNLALPANVPIDVAGLEKGYTIVNRSGHDVWRTVTITGSPVNEPPPVSDGYSLDVAYYSIDGAKLDPANVRQNDRFIVEISGSAQDDARHRTIIDAPLPASWEIETVIRKTADYPFLGALSKPSVAQAKDDRFIAAVDLGDGWPWLSSDDDDDDSSSSDDSGAKKPPKLDSKSFALAYIVRVVTPGTFTLPEAVVQDMYRPAQTARTSGGKTSAAPR